MINGQWKHLSIDTVWCFCWLFVFTMRWVRYMVFGWLCRASEWEVEGCDKGGVGRWWYECEQNLSPHQFNEYVTWKWFIESEPTKENKRTSKRKGNNNDNNKELKGTRCENDTSLQQMWVNVQCLFSALKVNIYSGMMWICVNKGGNTLWRFWDTKRVPISFSFFCKFGSSTFVNECSLAGVRQLLWLHKMIKVILRSNFEMGVKRRMCLLERFALLIEIVVWLCMQRTYFLNALSICNNRRHTTTEGTKKRLNAANELFSTWAGQQFTDESNMIGTG